MSFVITGAKAIFSINGTKVAYASEVNYNWTLPVHPIEVIDQLEIAEHAETGVRIEFSCMQFRVARQSVISLGIQPKLNKLLQRPELVVTIMSQMQVGGKKTSKLNLLQVNGVKLVGRSGSVAARGVWTETLSFVGRLVSDENGP